MALGSRGLALVKIAAQVGARSIEIQVERSDGLYIVDIDGERHVVDARKLEGDFYSLLTAGRSYEIAVECRGDAYHVRHGAAEQIVRLTDPGRKAREGMRSTGPDRIVTMMPGKVVRVLVEVGDVVVAGQGIAVVEAMKMENEITAGRDGQVLRVDVRPGQSVEGGALLAIVE